MFNNCTTTSQNIHGWLLPKRDKNLKASGMTYKKSLRDITITGFDWVPTDFAETDKEIFDNWFRKTYDFKLSCTDDIFLSCNEI